MGLDMYLIEKKYIGKSKIKIVENEYQWHKNVGKEYEEVSSIDREVGYWRKANQIHKWFVDNCQNGEDNCEEHYVELDKLKELLDICKKIKENCHLIEGRVNNGYTFKKDEEGNLVKEEIVIDGKVMQNSEIAEELLPTQSGFFFGGTDYDEYYMNDIDNTIKIIEDLLKEEDIGDIYYRSSW